MLPLGWGLEGERLLPVFSKTLVSASLFVFAALSPLRAQVPKDFHPNLAILRSPHADGNLSESRVLQALWCAASELHVLPEKLPRILVVHGGRDVGTVAGIPLWNWNGTRKGSGAVVAEPLPDGGRLYYLWVIGKPSDEVLAMGFVQILRPDALPADAELIASAKRVVLRMASVIDVNAIQKGAFARGNGLDP